MFLVIDIETERLENPEKIWLLVAKEVETGAVHVFRNLHNPNHLSEAHRRAGFRSDAAAATALLGPEAVVIGHNVIGFDLPVLRRLLLGRTDGPPDCNTIDTLVVSRLLNSNLEGGHGLEAWGQRLGSPKIYFKDFSCWSQEMEDYCIQDVEVTLKLYLKFKQFIFSPAWKESLRLEHEIAFISREMQDNGFYFDIDGARKLHLEISHKLDCLDLELQAAFPPRSTLVREITPKTTKHGTISRVDFRWLDVPDLSPFAVGASFSLIQFESFNPGSPKQIVERLNEAGWKPWEKTKGHYQAERARTQAARTGMPTGTKRGSKELTVEEWDAKLAHYKIYGWSVSEENLKTLPPDAPEAAQKLVQRLLLASRRSTLEEWFGAYNEQTRRIHGHFNHIGAWTHRMSHSGPNMANIPTGESLYAKDMRSFWQAEPEKVLVGVDADAIQLRVLAHYMNDKKFSEALVNGQKEDGTDAHTLNKNALGNICRTRDIAKTFIYAFLLGAGLAKVASILGCPSDEAKEAIANFLAAYPGLDTLKHLQIPGDASRGYFKGLDGRFVLCDNEHLMLAGYLQNGESIVMKRANVLWRKQLLEKGIAFKQVNYVHDEWIVEVSEEDSEDVKEILKQSIVQAGQDLHMNLPLLGTGTIGRNWYEVH